VAQGDFPVLLMRPMVILASPFDLKTVPRGATFFESRLGRTVFIGDRQPAGAERLSSVATGNYESFNSLLASVEGCSGGESPLTTAPTQPST